ncbi:MAG: protein-L-isoaspartate(D-aspartate) O-methyltransferase [Deltaproteobacteria bacterium]|nr:protein-L-isoaspartate(D-aspartate) O-methyltransferase [Deltaproteobacteria bacterium]
MEIRDFGVVPGVIVVALAAWTAFAETKPDDQVQRDRMVRTQVEARGVKDPLVLAAMRKVPRHRFVPANVRGAAYDDMPLSIGSEQTISQPYIVAFMTEAARLKRGDRVLEIGTGSGYQAAVLAEITDRVFTIEIICDLADRARTTLQTLGYEKIEVRCGDGYQGWKEHAPFDAIIVTAAPPEIPKPLIEQLAEGGRLVLPVGPNPEAQELVRLTKVGGELKRETLLPVRFVPLTGPGTGIPTPR